MKKRNPESGVMLILVSIVSLVLIALSAFAVDLGAAWYARSEAQRTADAGALAGAVALATDDGTWPFPANGIVANSANVIATHDNNRVWSADGVAVAVEVQAACPTWKSAPYDTKCVRVNVYRDAVHNNPLPTFFAPLVGVNAQGIRATATAQVLPANASGCLRPWFIPDLYNDIDADEMYDPGEFVGYKVPDNIGDYVTFHQNGAPSSYGQLDVGSGTQAIRDAIIHCVTGGDFYVGKEDVDTDPGNKLGQKSALDELINEIDPDKSAANPDGVYWDPVAKKVLGGCAASGTCDCGDGPCPYGGAQSPRIVQAVVCDPGDPDCSGMAGKGQIDVSKILSFFLLGYTIESGNLAINAVIIGSGGELDPSGDSVDPGNAFLYVISLVQ